MGDGGTILHSVDGGATWISQDSGTSERLSAVTFTSATRGRAVGDGGVILRTANAGATLVAQPSRTASNLGDVDFINGRRGWTSGRLASDKVEAAGDLLRTSDAGAHWTRLTSSVTRHDLNASDFRNAYRGWVVGDAGTILRTDTAGVAWRRQVSGTKEDLNSVDFVDGQNGWAVGGYDGGEYQDPSQQSASSCTPATVGRRGGPS